MSKDGRIGNRGLLKAIADALRMEGVNRFPADLNRDQVQPVVTMDPSWSAYTQQDLSTTNTDGIGNNPSFTWEPVGLGAASQSVGIANSGYVVSTGFENLILGVSIQLTYDAAGAVADNGKNLMLQLYRVSWPVGISVVTVGSYRRWDTVSAGRTRYTWSWPMGILSMPGVNVPQLHQGPDGLWVPQGSQFGFIVSYEDGTNFANNTQFWGMASIIRTPMGIPLPR